jgi:hypothetical protein
MIYSGREAPFSPTGMMLMEERLTEPGWCLTYVENNVRCGNVTLHKTPSEFNDEQLEVIARAIYDNVLLTEIKKNGGVH